MNIKQIVKNIFPQKDFNIIKRITYKPRYAIKKMQARKYFCTLNKHKSQIESIKVGFLVQVPEIWDKQAPVFEAMTKDSRFEPYLIIIPSSEFGSFKISGYGKELKYFEGLYDTKYIIKAYADNKWLDLKQLNLSYVFYPRCWEIYIPEQYHTNEMIKHIKTCYIPYAVAGLNDGYYYYRSSFFTYLYMSFCTTKAQESFYPEIKNRIVSYLGAPALEIFSNKLDNYDKKHTFYNVLWTPRWTTDKTFGGSTFLAYMNKILLLPKKYSAINLTLRPHPLAFEKALQDGILSSNDIEKYKLTVVETGAKFDENKLVEDTLLSTDILITDYSSIIIEYFLTGKPIIYCGDINVDFEEIYCKMVKTFYVATSWEDVERYVDDLICGIDVKAEERKAIASSLVEESRGATNRILQCIYDDNNSTAK